MQGQKQIIQQGGPGHIRETIVIMWTRVVAVEVDKGGDSEGGEKWPDSGYTLKVEIRGFSAYKGEKS